MSSDVEVIAVDADNVERFGIFWSGELISYHPIGKKALLKRLAAAGSRA